MKKTKQEIVEISKEELIKIIAEELEAYMLEEGFLDDIRNKGRKALATAALGATLAGAAPDASADSITNNPDQYKQAVAAQTAAMDKFVQAKKEFDEKLGVTDRRDYINKTGAKDFKERQKFGDLYDEAVRFYSKTKKASEDGNPKFPDGGVVLNILDKEKIETQKERRFANLKIFFGSVIDEGFMQNLAGTIGKKAKTAAATAALGATLGLGSPSGAEASPTNDTKVVNVTGDTITAQDVADKLKRDKEAKALGIPTENEFIKAAFERVKKGQREKGWWGQDTKFRGNLNLWKSSMLNKYRNNIEDFKASLK
tara:strand:- start:493 stop:1431 length:939 start_codon:yes stop_codon:yes gene_type:complete